MNLTFNGTAFEGGTALPTQIPQINSQYLGDLTAFEQTIGSNVNVLMDTSSEVVAGNGTYTVVFHGAGLTSVSGTITSFQIYKGASFYYGTVTGGTQIASTTFSASRMTMTVGNVGIVVDGTNLPTTAVAIEDLAMGFYSGPSISLSDVKLTSNGQTVFTMGLAPNALTYKANGYTLTLTGNFTISASAALINAMALGLPTTASSDTVSGGTLTRDSDGAVLATLSDTGPLATVMSSLTVDGHIVGPHQFDVPGVTVASGTTLAGGATVTVASGGVADGLVVDSGGILAVSGNGAVNGTVLSGGGTLAVAAGADPSGTVTFTGSGGVVRIGGSGFSAPAAAFSGFGEGDIIDFTGGTVTSAAVSGGTMTVAFADGSHASLNLPGAAAGTYKTVADGHGGTDILGAAGVAPGDFLGAGRSQALFYNDRTGGLVVGAVSGSQLHYTPVGGFGAEWSIEATGDFQGGGAAQVMLYNANSHALVIGTASGGSLSYNQVGSVGPEWQCVGSGKFLGGSQANVLLHNSGSGGLVVGGVSGGSVAWTSVGGFGAEWQVEGSGDILGDGKAGFLMWDTQSGALDVGEVSGGAVAYTAVGGLGAEWKFHGVGDFLGNGRDGFLLENANTGVLVVGDAGGGSAAYTQIGAIGPEWTVTGTGDYAGGGTAGFMLENSNGALALGTVAGGHAGYTAIGGVGPEWKIH